jgi:hypothetical protein
MWNLSPERASIFRITHRDNIPWILEHGLHCRNSTEFDTHFITIGNAELIEMRTMRHVPIPPHGTLNDYIPFYFTPFSPMMYKIHTGHGGIPKRSNDEIVILAASLHGIAQSGAQFLFTDRHAYLRTANFYDSLDRLDQIDWPLLRRRDFQRNPDDPEKVERYQAEALVHKFLPVEGLIGMVCSSAEVESRLQNLVSQRGLTLQIAALPKWYFQ